MDEDWMPEAHLDELLAGSHAGTLTTAPARIISNCAGLIQKALAELGLPDPRKIADRNVWEIYLPPHLIQGKGEDLTHWLLINKLGYAFHRGEVMWRCFQLDRLEHFLKHGTDCADGGVPINAAEHASKAWEYPAFHGRGGIKPYPPEAGKVIVVYRARALRGESSSGRKGPTDYSFWLPKKPWDAILGAVAVRPLPPDEHQV